jgi:uncharacterized membrane protein YcaP (DUF421 family)
MKKEEIFISDWQRILLGNAPWEFMAEVFIRTVIIYLVLVVIMRLLGKRMNAQLTITELAVMITLGGIVSVPMQVPERGIVIGMVILVIILVLHRGLNWLAFKYRKVEVMSQGDIQLMVKDGRLDLTEVGKARISRQQLFAQLRTQDVQHLGQVKRAYFEACGRFSVFPEKKPKPGLSILPETDDALLQAEPREEKMEACAACGHIVPKDRTHQGPCLHCGQNKWTYAVQEKTLAFQEKEL